ncbi:hypothetical protein DPMN_193279 [Dreissena polymorpha]|uniref:Uncharacterized protein n=1 Tax=Dreissena polymorpha TaxID=45954 RepID=A0A9D3Y6N0_DREPO|nr:hypothetical protein DPMN_193279 [Dreissena polymorpha]
MQIDDELDEAICTSPMILETVDDKVYAPRTSAHETLETVGQVEDGVGKFIKIPFFNCEFINYSCDLLFTKSLRVQTKSDQGLQCSFPKPVSLWRAKQSLYVVGKLMELLVHNLLSLANAVAVLIRTSAAMVNVTSESQVGDGSSTNEGRFVLVMESRLYYLLKEKVEQDGRKQTSLTDAH